MDKLRHIKINMKTIILLVKKKTTNFRNAVFPLQRLKPRIQLLML